MIFSSNIFMFIFLPITLLLYFFGNKKVRNLVLLVASLIFYAWGEPVYVCLMLLSILFNYTAALLMERFDGKVWVRKVILWLTVVVNLSGLVYFKYIDFIISNINAIFKSEITLPNVALPIGISFFTFQAMSYVIDVYWNNVKTQKSIIKLALYISLFPQLIAGPIVRYIDIEKDIDNRVINSVKLYEGTKRFILGFSKKILLADQLAPLADQAFAATELKAGVAWLGILAYSLQIFFDFSAYSDMAIGLGKIFGFEFMENFNYPYISKSIKEFWRRWHISLSTWFRDYVYIPLGGNRCSRIRNYFNLLAVFFLTGIWHGASWNFIVWGMYHGLFQLLEKGRFGALLDKCSTGIRRGYTLLVVLFGWIFFRAENLTAAIKYIGNMFNFSSGWWKDVIFALNKEYVLFIAVAIVFSCPIGKKIEERLPRKIYDIGSAVLFCVAIAYMVGKGFSPFLYFRF